MGAAGAGCGLVEAELAGGRRQPMAGAAPGLVEAELADAEPADGPRHQPIAAAAPGLVEAELAELPRFRAGLEALVAEALRLPAGRMRTHGLRANLKLLASAPAEPRRWVVRVVEEALKQAEALRRWVTERTRPGG